LSIDLPCWNVTIIAKHEMYIGFTSVSARYDGYSRLQVTSHIKKKFNRTIGPSWTISFKPWPDFASECHLLCRPLLRGASNCGKVQGKQWNHVKPEFNPEHSFDENFLGLEKNKGHTRSRSLVQRKQVPKQGALQRLRWHVCRDGNTQWDKIGKHWKLKTLKTLPPATVEFSTPSSSNRQRPEWDARSFFELRLPRFKIESWNGYAKIMNTKSIMITQNTQTVHTDAFSWRLSRAALPIAKATWQGCNKNRAD
jgi:hypothetical protein